MSKVRKLFSIAVLVLMFVAVSSVLAGNTHTTVLQSDVGWTIPAGQCSSLPAGISVTGNGHRHMVTNTKANADGSTDILINDLVEGDAWDNNGGTYHWKYSNHSTQHVPASGLPIQNFMNDSFVMNGANHLSVGFVMRWTTTDPSDTSFPPTGATIINTHGDPFHCDPI